MPTTPSGDLLQTTRIAVYDDLLAAPRIVDIEPADIDIYIENITTQTYNLAREAGGDIPYTVIREVAENFIHADFKEPCISILDKGNTIRFTDQGPGISDKMRAQQPGFTSATSEMRNYIRGVGSGLPQVRTYLDYKKGGRLVIEDNINHGTVITIQVEQDKTPITSDLSQSQREAIPTFERTEEALPITLSQRELDILATAAELGPIGPSIINTSLGISVSTAYRLLNDLESSGLLETNASRKRTITEKGLRALEG